MNLTSLPTGNFPQHLHSHRGASLFLRARISLHRIIGFLVFGTLAHLPLLATDTFNLEWFTVNGGGANMSGGDFTLEGTTGQTDVSLATLVNEELFLKSGYWAFDFSAIGNLSPTIQLQRSASSELTLSWYPDTPGFRLQQSLTLMPDSWLDLSSSQENPMQVLITGERQFYRLIKP